MLALVRPDPVSVATHLVVTLLFTGLFAFLYREARNVYFHYWSLAWFLLFSALLMRLGDFKLAAGLLQLAFAASLLFAGSSVTAPVEVRLTSRALLIPALGAVLYAGGVLGGLRGAAAGHSVLLMGIYGWNYVTSRRLWKAGSGSGRKIFCVALATGAILAFHDAVTAATLLPAGPVSGYFRYLRYSEVYYLVFETLLAFSAIMMWMEAQNEELRRANEELAESRKQIARTAEIDPLTGLLNRNSLNKTCEANRPVTGVVAVVDLDNFKDVNDALGHLTGDEVLAAVGNLIRSSIRSNTDQAWRWGGDEFVILFQEQNTASAQQRLLVLEQHLDRFRIRGRGVLPVRLSWGMAEIVDGSLRQAIEEADRHMYLKKKEKTSSSKFFRD